MSNRTEWVYTYDDNSNRTGMIEKEIIADVPAKTVKGNFNDVWCWGNPLQKKSDARFFITENYNVMKTVIGSEFARTLAIWEQNLINLDTTVSELVKVAQLERDSMAQGETGVQTRIAVTLGTSQSRVHRMLMLISLTRIEEEISAYEYLGETSYGISEGNMRNWYPSKKEIEHKAASIPRICAVGHKGCKGETRNGKIAICYNCHVKMKTESPFALLSDWVVSEERRIRREHYKEAVNACFEDYYGTVSIDEYEYYSDAA